MFRRWTVRYLQSFSLTGCSRHAVLRGVADADAHSAQLRDPGRAVGLLGRRRLRRRLFPALALATISNCPSRKRVSCLPQARRARSPAASSAWSSSGAPPNGRTRSAPDGLDPVDTAHPLEVGAIALATFILLIALARLFKMTLYFVSEAPQPLRPQARLLCRRHRHCGAVVLVDRRRHHLPLWAARRRQFVRAARCPDAAPKRSSRPIPTRPGSAASLVRWQDLGRMGRSYIATARRAPISAVSPASRRSSRSASMSACIRTNRRKRARSWRSPS